MDHLLSVEEATNKVYSELEQYTGWNFLKSQRCLKKKVGGVDFEIPFSTCKWNRSNEYVGINAYFQIVYKKFGKLPVENAVAYFAYRPATKGDSYWYDISTKEKLASVIDILKEEIQKTALYQVSCFEKDQKEAVKRLFEDHFNDYHVRLDFAADILGIEAVISKVRSIVDSLSDEEKKEIIDYRNGKKTKAWMRNPTNLRFIVDNNLIDKEL